jgi:amidohydrolase
MIDPRRLDELVERVLPTVVEVRRAIHRHPELSGEEYETTALLSRVLSDAGMVPRSRTPRTGLTVDIGSGSPVVAFRADIDALPIQEPPEQACASRIPGVMHACGHDAHAAIGLGVALVLGELTHAMPGRVRMIFQPAEETFPGGAHDLVREGVMDGIRSIIAYHVDPGLQAGRIGLKVGAITSSADRFHITLEGPGGHTARPHQTVDLITVAGLVVTQVPALLDRLTDARAPVALVFGRIHGGSADNVIPSQVELSGTLRTADRNVWEEIPTRLERLVNEVTAPLGPKVHLHYLRGLPPVINDARIVQRLERIVATTLGESQVSTSFLSMGAEDFSRYLEEAPGALMRLGCGDGSQGIDLHSASFRLDEACLAPALNVAVNALLDLMT